MFNSILLKEENLGKLYFGLKRMLESFMCFESNSISNNSSFLNDIVISYLDKSKDIKGKKGCDTFIYSKELLILQFIESMIETDDIFERTGIHKEEGPKIPRIDVNVFNKNIGLLIDDFEKNIDTELVNEAKKQANYKLTCLFFVINFCKQIEEGNGTLSSKKDEINLSCYDKEYLECLNLPHRGCLFFYLYYLDQIFGLNSNKNNELSYKFFLKNDISVKVDTKDEIVKKDYFDKIITKNKLDLEYIEYFCFNNFTPNFFNKK